MKIINKRPVTMTEVALNLKNVDENKPIHNYIKKFKSLDKQKSEKLVESVRALNNPKIKEEDIVKVADFLPRDSEDVNKIFTEVSLNEEEINSILQIVKEY